VSKLPGVKVKTLKIKVEGVEYSCEIDCGCPSPEPETLHEATGIRICNACEAKAAEKAREYVRDS